MGGIEKGVVWRVFLGGTVGNGKDRAQTGIRKKVMSQAPDNPTVRNWGTKADG